MTADLIAKRYSIIEKLGEGGMGTVYAAYDRLKKEQVAFKQIRQNQVSNWSTNDTIEKVVLAHEFQILASLKHPHIISVIDFGFAGDDNPYFTMTLLNDPQTIVEYGLRLSLEQRIDLILQMLLALAYLHRNGIIHRDLKPDNALVTPNGRLRVLDFGIAVPDRYEEDGDTISGTLAYMAPEIIMGKPITHASDLYAVGVIAYQLFAGHHPFDLSQTYSLVNEVINKAPDMDILQTRLQNVGRGGLGYLETDEIEKTAQVDPPTIRLDAETLDEHRAETLRMMAEDVEQTLKLKPGTMHPGLPPQTPPQPAKQAEAGKKQDSIPATGEVAGLVGIINRLMAKEPEERYQSAEDVIEAICSVFDRPFPDDVAIRESYLQAAKFVGRENEIKMLRKALEDSLKTNTGSAWLVGGESGIGKSRLLNEVRIEALVRGMVVLGGQGVVGGGIVYQFWREPLRRLAVAIDVTDIEASTLKAIIPDIDELIGRPVEDAPILEETGKDRLINVIVNMFRKIEQPVMLILEDLQWGEESLDVLRALLPLSQDQSLTIVASYRSDERPDLPQELPDMELIYLERLDEHSIEALSESMLGVVGRNQQVIELLKRETEGNVFFLVEVVRVLAQEAGHLAQIGEMQLPERVFAGGIQQIVEHRFERVPEWAHYPLRLAAVAGRQLTIEMIQDILPDLDMEKWLTVCSAAAVVEVADGQWRFAHEKLREGLIASLDDSERQRLHYQVARGLVDFYGDSPDYAMLICEHFEQAGATEEAAYWFVPAGSAAQNAYVGSSASTYFEKAIFFWASNPDLAENFPVSERITAYQGLGTMYFWQGRYDDAIGIFEAQRELAEQSNSRDAHANALHWIASCKLHQGDTQGALDMLEKAEAVAQNADTRKPLAQVLWVRGIISYISGDFKSTLEHGQELLAIAEAYDIQNLLAQGNNLLGAVHYAQGNYKTASEHWAKQYELSVAIADHGPAISALNNLGLVAEALGDYDTAYSRFEEALELIDQAGIRDQYMLFLSNLGGAQVRREQYEDAEAKLHTVIDMASKTPFGQLSETYRFLAEALIAQFKVPEAVVAVQESMALAENSGSPELLAGAWRALGQVASVLGDTVNPTADSGEAVDADECFTRSEAIYHENGMVGDRARTLREWARHAYRYGNEDRGWELWKQAKALFQRVGADREVVRMDNGL